MSVITSDDLAGVIAACLDSPVKDGKCTYVKKCERLLNTDKIPCPENKNYTSCPAYRANLIIDIYENEIVEIA